MELSSLEGKIIGLISDQKEDLSKYNEKVIKDIVTHRTEDSLKMVGLEVDVQDKLFNDLSSREKSKAILASKLNDDEIVLYDFSKGLIKKDLDFFKRLFKKISSYNKKIYLYSKDAELFINLVDKIYILNAGEVTYQTDNMFDPTIYIELEMPGIVSFIYKCEDLGYRLDEYTDINELIKAIYRIKQ